VYQDVSRVLEQVNVLMDFFQTVEAPQMQEHRITGSTKSQLEKRNDPNLVEINFCFEEFILPES
jgi:hypothetical protein